MKTKLRQCVALLLVLLLTLVIFPRSAQAARNPVLIVPGLTGTELYKNGNLLWPDVVRMASDIGDQFLDPLAFDRNLSPQDSSINVGQVIKQIWHKDYTDGLIKNLERVGYRENEDLFTFPYDWRFSVIDNASLMSHRINQVMALTGSSKVDVVAHSTGGLITKKYIMDSPNENIDKAIFVGVPHLGAPKATKTLLAGDNLGILVLSDDEIKKIAQNMPVIYDLAPSQQYHVLQGNYLSINTRKNFTGTTEQILDYNQTKNYLANQGANKLAMHMAEELHTAEFDNFDVRNKGVDAYNLLNCNNPTLGWVVDYRSDPPIPFYNGYGVRFVSGDGTVPYASARVLPTDPGKTVFVPQVDHSELLSSEPGRQEIAGILTRSDGPPIIVLGTPDNQCTFPNGRTISIFSPVEVEVLDSSGKNVGQVERVGEHKFVFVPDNKDYTVKLKGTGSGKFSLTVDQIQGEQIISTSAYYNMNVTPKSVGELDLADDTHLQWNGVSYSPAVLTPEDALDAVPPELRISFNQSTKDLVFTATDNLPGPLTLEDKGSLVLARDRAGNTIELKLAQNDRKKELSGTISDLSYNGQTMRLGKAKFAFQWSLDKRGRLQYLTQEVRSKQGSSLLAKYDGIMTIVTRVDSSGRSIYKYPGLKLFQIITSRGDFQLNETTK